MTLFFGSYAHCQYFLFVSAAYTWQVIKHTVVILLILIWLSLRTYHEYSLFDTIYTRSILYIFFVVPASQRRDYIRFPRHCESVALIWLKIMPMKIEPSILSRFFYPNLLFHVFLERLRLVDTQH